MDFMRLEAWLAIGNLTLLIRLMEVTGSWQSWTEPCKTKTGHLYTLLFVQIKQMGRHVLIRGAVNGILLCRDTVVLVGARLAVFSSLW